MPDWKLNEAGDILLHPLVGTRVATNPLLVLCQLRYAHLVDGQPQVAVVQLGLPPEQARQFAQDLAAAANQLLAKGKGNA